MSGIGSMELMWVCDAVILAAGSSSRLGFSKQLLELQGQSLLRRISQAAVASGCRKTYVVLGYQKDTLSRQVADLPVAVLENEDWMEGMGSSVRLAARQALVEVPPADGLLFLTCDQPRVGETCIRRLLEASAKTPGTIIAAAYSGTLGVPAVFKRPHFQELTLVQGNQGARPLLQAHRDRVLPLPMPEAAVDIDTPQDWENLKRSE